MKLTHTVIAWLLLAVASAIPASAKDWRGIVPLISTRNDVERLLGPPTTDRGEITFYEFERERVSFHYSRGPCSVEPKGWDVPRDTVISIWITPKPHLLKLADLKLDESKFKKKRDHHVWDVFSYINEEEGLSYEVDTRYDGMVTLIQYYPPAQDSHLLCPGADDVIEDTLKIDEYSGLSFESEKERLDGFAEKLVRYSDTQGYIMAYAGKRARAGEAEARGTRVKDYLVKVRGVGARRFVIVDSGHREEWTIELYLVPSGATPPPATPTVDPNEVQIEGGKAKSRRLRLKP